MHMYEEAFTSGSAIDYERDHNSLSTASAEDTRYSWPRTPALGSHVILY